MKRKQCLSFLRLTSLWHLHLSPLTNSSEKQGGVDSFSLPLILPFKHGNSWLTACCALFRRHGLGRTGRGMQEEGGGEKKGKRGEDVLGDWGTSCDPNNKDRKRAHPPPSSCPPQPWLVIPSWSQKADSSPESCPATVRADGDRDRRREKGIQGGERGGVMPL